MRPAHARDGAPLARLLLTLERSAATGDLLIRWQRDAYRVRCDRGRLVSARSLSDLPPAAPWTPLRSCAVHDARTALRSRLEHLLTLPRPELRFSPQLPSRSRVDHSTTAVVLQAVRRLSRRRSAEDMGRRLNERMELSRLGRYLLRDAPLAPEERVVLAALEHGSLDLEALIGIAGASLSALRGQWVMRTLGAFDQAVGPARGRIVDLARKRRQLSRGTPEWQVLELRPEDTGAKRRAAARRLAASFHPDRFAGHAPDAVSRASEAVTRELLALGHK